MEYYQIGPLGLLTESAPESYRPFRKMRPAMGGAELTVERVSGVPELGVWRRLAEHAMMNVWKPKAEEAGWLLEDRSCSGWMWVAQDYRTARFYAPDHCPQQALQQAFALLLQAAVECALIRQGFLVLHAACVRIEGQGVAFSGPSGSGKSTRALQWTQHLDGTWISGDRPMIDPDSGSVYGVPWDGKEQIFTNVCAPLRCIMEVRRAGHTQLRRMTAAQARSFLAGQLLIPMWDTALAARALSGMERLLRSVPIYRLYSDQDEQTAQEIYETLFRFPQRIRDKKEETKMKLKQGFEVVEMEGDYLALPTGENVAAFAGSVVLNEVSAALLREMAQRECSREDLLELLLNEYEVEREVAAADLDGILKTFSELGLIQ